MRPSNGTTALRNRWRTFAFATREEQTRRVNGSERELWPAPAAEGLWGRDHTLAEKNSSGRCLATVWFQPFWEQDEQTRWRAHDDIAPASKRMSSPDDSEARMSVTRRTMETGEKVYLTETGDKEMPHLITPIEWLQRVGRMISNGSIRSPSVQADRPGLIEP